MGANYSEIWIKLHLHSRQCIWECPPFCSGITTLWTNTVQYWISSYKDRAHLSTFKIFIFEKFSCFIVLVVFLVIVQSSELVSVWFCDKMTFFLFFCSYHIFAIYVGGASLGLPTACRLIAVSGARLPSVDGLVVRCIKMHHHVKSAITICLQFIQNMFTIYTCIPTHRGSAPVFYLQKSPSWGIYVNWINFNPSMDK